MIHSHDSKEELQLSVVNCFQFINFVNDSQSIANSSIDNTGCELLSVH